MFITKNCINKEETLKDDLTFEQLYLLIISLRQKIPTWLFLGSFFFIVSRHLLFLLYKDTLLSAFFSLSPSPSL